MLRKLSNMETASGGREQVCSNYPESKEQEQSPGEEPDQTPRLLQKEPGTSAEDSIHESYYTVDQLEDSSTCATRAWWHDAITALAPLWVGGAAVLCLLLAYLAKPALARVSERADVWAQYLALGT